MSLKFWLPILVLVLVLPACSDDDPAKPTTDPSLLVTIHLGEYFLEAFATEGLVFASDPEGNVLDVATWDGTGTIELKNATVQPDTISFTFFQSSDWELVFATELGVPRGSVFDYPGHTHSEHTGSADLTFANAPDCYGYRISSNWTSVSGDGPFPASRTIQTYGDSTDCYVRIDPVGKAPTGGWIRALKPGDSAVFDFDQPGAVAPLTRTNVQMSSAGDRLTCNLSGIVYSGFSRSFISFEFLVFQESTPRSVNLYTPEFPSAQLNSFFHLLVDGPLGKFYSQESSGPIPPAFTMLEGDLEVISASPDSMIFHTTADWDRSFIVWNQAHEIYSSWYFEGPSSVQSFALPEIPDSVADQFPDYPRDGFYLRHVEIVQHTTKNMERSLGEYISMGPDKKAPRGALGVDFYPPKPAGGY